MQAERLFNASLENLFLVSRGIVMLLSLGSVCVGVEADIGFICILVRMQFVMLRPSFQVWGQFGKVRPVFSRGGGGRNERWWGLFE